MSPFGDAVNLIDRQQRDRCPDIVIIFLIIDVQLRNLVGQSVTAQHLGRKIQYVYLVLRNGPENCIPICLAEGLWLR